MILLLLLRVLLRVRHCRGGLRYRLCFSIGGGRAKCIVMGVGKRKVKE